MSLRSTGTRDTIPPKFTAETPSNFQKSPYAFYDLTNWRQFTIISAKLATLPIDLAGIKSKVPLKCFRQLKLILRKSIDSLKAWWQTAVLTCNF